MLSLVRSRTTSLPEKPHKAHFQGTPWAGWQGTQGTAAPQSTGAQGKVRGKGSWQPLSALKLLWVCAVIAAAMMPIKHPSPAP